MCGERTGVCICPCMDMYMYSVHVVEPPFLKMAGVICILSGQQIESFRWSSEC